MLIENDLQTEDSFKAWAKKDATTNNYQEQRGYFKIAEMSTKEGATNCRFKTADRIWWDICGTNDSNIENPIIILDGKYKDADRSELEMLAKTEKVDGKKVYVYALVGRRDETTGSVRIDDKAYETTSPNKEYLEKVYAFLEKRDMIVADAGGGNSNGICNGENSCEVDDLTYKKVSFSEEPTVVNLSNGDTSTSVATGDKYVTVVASGKGWEYAQTACPDGTHLAKAAEIQQMANNGSLYTLCENCEYSDYRDYTWFWAAEGKAYTYETAGYYFSRYNNRFDDAKDNYVNNNQVVCVED
ncbi:hypothetical protein IJS77_00675 [bacterium]|nr:hypothetical protein [bacterium]